MFEVDKKMSIAMAIGNIKNVRLQIGEMSFQQFSEFCSRCQAGGKHESYFIRGTPEYEENYVSRSGQEHGPGYYRHDEPLLSAAFLVIDADHSHSTPKQCHDALKHLDYIHFIYTSHSHTAKENNFRAVIPCEISSKKYMQATARKIISELEDAGCPIEFTNEMGTWSQAWFLPTRSDPADGLFEHYECFDGTPYQELRIDMKAEKDAGNLTGMDEGGAQTLDQLYEVIRTGGQGLHDALRTISYQTISDGMHPTHAAANLRALMNGAKDDVKNARWQERYNEIDALCSNVDVGEDEAPEELEVFSAAEPEGDAAEVGLDWPPGLMGDYAKSMYNSALYQNKIVASTLVLGVIAGIAGRSFNINGMGLSLYITYLGKSGFGKNSIKEFITASLNSESILKTSAGAFMLPSSFTGDKALLDILNAKRCGLSIQTESGFRRMKKSGDPSSLQGAILDLFSTNGQYSVYGENAYSDSKNNTPPIQAPSLTIIEESTPDLYLDALKDGTQTGQFNRMLLFKLDQKNESALLINRKRKFHLSPKVAKKIQNLVSHCIANQKCEVPDTAHFDATDQMFDFADKCKLEAARLADQDEQKFTMLQRAAEKAFRVAAIITLFNRHFNKGQREGLEVDQDAWDWSVKLHEFEMAGLEEFFKKSGQNGIDDIIEKNIIKPIKKLLQPKGTTEKPYGGKDMSMQTTDIRDNLIPMYIFRRALKNCKAINELGRADFGKSGLNIVIKYMEDNGYAKVTPDKRKIKIKSQLFQNFIN